MLARPLTAELIAEDAISTAAAPAWPTKKGIEGGVDGGIEGGIEGGVDGGTEGGIDGGVDGGMEGALKASSTVVLRGASKVAPTASPSCIEGGVVRSERRELRSVVPAPPASQPRAPSVQVSS
jgi:hypothetical protein